MAATIIDGREAAARVRAEVAREVDEFFAQTGRRPGLATILVGDDPASEIYVRNKRKSSTEVGIADFHRHLPADARQDEVAAVIEQGNQSSEISGILLQLPVPEGLDGSALTGMIFPDKDVDGLTPISAGRLAQNLPGLRPCTPLGIRELLDSHDVMLEGAAAVVPDAGVEGAVLAVVALADVPPVLTATSGLCAAVFLVLRHTATVTSPTVLGATGFTAAGLAATSVPIHLPWVPLLAPLAVLALYVLVTRPFWTS